MDGTVLIADDDRTIRTVLVQAFTRAGCKVHATSSLTTLMRWVGEGRGDVVISDVVMPDGNGLEMLPKIAQDRPGLPVIVISAQNTIMTAIRANEAEAFDYLPKPFDLPDLMKRTARALDSRKTRAAAGGGDDRPEELPLVGRSAPMQALYQLVARVIHGDMPVLIRGETGTGKSMIAHALHDFSDRRTLPFVTLDPADLTTAEGPARLLARARGGTVLLDGLGDLDEGAQARLVRMIDMPGDPAPRFVATTRTEGQREGLADALYYRLGGAVIDVPPLRARIDDIPLLADHFLARADGPARRFSDGALARLKAQRWPGNVRQMENTIARLSLMAQGEEIGEAEIARLMGEELPGPAEEGTAISARETLSGAVERHLKRYFDMHGDMLPPPGLYARILREMEAPLLSLALDATGGNQAKCADLLGINRNTLRKKLTDLDIRVTRRRKLM